MTGSVHQITRLLFGTDRLEEVSIDELRDLVEDYPSFSAGHYLLSKKLQLAGHEAFVPESERTSLYFTNPFWLENLLRRPVAEPHQQEETEDHLSRFSTTNDDLHTIAEPSVFQVSEPAAEIEQQEVLVAASQHSSTEEFHPATETIDRPATSLHESDAVLAHNPGSFSVDDGPDFSPELTQQESIMIQELEQVAPDEKRAGADSAAREAIFAQPESEGTPTLQSYAVEAKEEAPKQEIPSTPEWVEEESISNQQFEQAVADNEDPAQVSVEESTPEQPAGGDPLDTTPRSYFFWEKEYYVKDSNGNKPVTAETPAPPNAEDQFPENPAFLLLEEDQFIAKQPAQEAATETPVEAAEPEEENDSAPEPAFVANELEITPESPATEWAADAYDQQVHVAQTASEEALADTADLPSSIEASDNKEEGKKPEASSIEPGVEDHADESETQEPAATKVSEDRIIYEPAASEQVAFEPANWETAAIDPGLHQVAASAARAQAESAAAPAPVAASDPSLEEELQFTPYHTVDYFASLGIRFIQEENPTDKFGKQLKSFTAWLKTMKRLPTTLIDTEMNAMTEAAIQGIAEHSIEEKEVITEAMAEVLALQGKSEKAIDLYTKLSLLNPAKSAYFAGKIDQLKAN